MHHTASNVGDYESYFQQRSNGASKSELDKYTFYHIIIQKDGTRQQYRRAEEDARATRNNNVNALHIAMVGNFDKEKPTKKQIETLKNIIKVTRKELGPIKVYEHGELEGEHTRCAGEHFNTSMLADKPIKQEPPKQETYLGHYRLTRYYTPERGQPKYYNGTYEKEFYMNCQGDCRRTANGHYLVNADVGKALACPPNIRLGTKLRLKRSRGHEVIGTCHDRGGAIKGKRLDVWSGIGYEGYKNIFVYNPTPSPNGTVQVWIVK